MRRSFLRLALAPARVRTLAREADRRELARRAAPEAADRERFEAVMRKRLRGFLLGRHGETEYRVPATEIPGQFCWLTAATGSGKSRLVGGILHEFLIRIVSNEPISIVLVDLKGELADLALRAAAEVAMRHPAEAPRFLERLHVLRFFSPRHLPEWQVLRREPSAGLLTQAHGVAEALEGASAALGVRQESATTFLVALAIEQGLSLLELRALLYAGPKRLGELAERSSLAEARLYVRGRLIREKAQTLDGVIARLDALLRCESLKAACAGPGMFDCRRAYAPGAITILDFGGAPLGAEDAKRTLATVAMTRLAWAAFAPDRKVEGATAVFCDEIQEAGPGVFPHVERIVTTGRSFGLGLWSVHQGAHQLPAELRAVLDTNVRIRILGRSGEADARTATEWLPSTGRMPRPRLPGEPPGDSPRFLGHAEELRSRISELGSLPARHFLVAERMAPFLPRVIETPPFDPMAWARIPEQVREAVQRGAVGVPRSELEARARRIEDAAVTRLLAEERPRRPARAGASGDAEPLPNVVALHAARSRGRMP